MVAREARDHRIDRFPDRGSGRGLDSRRLVLIRDPAGVDNEIAN